jgi:hypothetical protein
MLAYDLAQRQAFSHTAIWYASYILTDIELNSQHNSVLLISEGFPAEAKDFDIALAMRLAG